MTDPFGVIHTRVRDVVCNGRGADGALGADAQVRALASGRFRYTDVPIDNLDLAGQAFDRGLHMRWIGLVDGGAGPNASIYDRREQDIALEVLVGYVEGAALANLVHKYDPSEDAAAAVLMPRPRASRDAALIARALGYYALTGGNLDADGQNIIIVRAAGPSRFDDLGGGRLVCASPFTVSAWTTNTT